MVWKKGQSGNPNGRKKGELSYTEAIRKHIDPEYLAQQLAAQIADGNMDAIKYAYNRLEGTPAATLTLEGSEDRPLHVRRSERDWDVAAE